MFLSAKFSIVLTKIKIYFISVTMFLNLTAERGEIIFQELVVRIPIGCRHFVDRLATYLAVLPRETVAILSGNVRHEVNDHFIY